MTIKGLSLNWHHSTLFIHHVFCKIRFSFGKSKKSKKFKEIYDLPCYKYKAVSLEKNLLCNYIKRDTMI